MSIIVEKTIKTMILLSIRFGLPLFTIGPKKWNKTRQTINILKAYIDNNEHVYDFTDQLNLILNWYWDNELCDENGGLSLDKLKTVLPTEFQLSQIYILFMDFIKNNTNENITKIQVWKYNLFNKLHTVNIDLNRKISSFQTPKSITEAVEHNIMFNQISFNLNFAY
jgi:hypothetical protein